MKNPEPLCRKTIEKFENRGEKEFSVAGARELIASLSSIFWGPDLTFCSRLLNVAFLGEMKKSAEFLGVRQDSIAQLEAFLEPYSDPARLNGDLESEYVRLFVNSVHGIVAPLYQSCYRREERRIMGPEAIEMAHRLERSGVTLAPAICEPPDHLCIELEYLYYLLSGDGESVSRKALEEAKDFCLYILKPWVELMFNRLKEDPGDSFYIFWCELLLRLLDHIQLFSARCRK